MKRAEPVDSKSPRLTARPSPLAVARGSEGDCSPAREGKQCRVGGGAALSGRPLSHQAPQRLSGGPGPVSASLTVATSYLLVSSEE